MKRRNAEGGKFRRPLKRPKITEGISGSSLLYAKFLTLWAIILFIDFIVEFRFEFLWPFWLLLRSVYDSFKYQGLAFSALFVCIAATSDMICFFFIPVHWLFFLASTYVWVQYVWHTEKGICLPTVVLCILFVYVEAMIRLRHFKHFPSHMDLCRPFAAHCIGYPVVTFGFGFKSYVGYRIRQKKQKEVAKENEFYMQLIQQALPIQEDLANAPELLNVTNSEKIRGSLSSTESDTGKICEGFSIGPVQLKIIGKNYHRKSCDKDLEKDRQEKKVVHISLNNSVNSEMEGTEKLKTQDKINKGNLNKSVSEYTNNNHKEKKNKSNKEGHSDANGIGYKDEYLLRLENDVKKLKVDLQISKQSEGELRSQLSNITLSERTTKTELTQLQHLNEDLQTRLHSLVSGRQLDKQTMSQLEKKLAEERRARGSCEAQLAAERKAKKAEEAAAAQAIAMATLNKGECTEMCRSKRREFEADIKQLRRELKLKEERILASDREIQSLRQYNENHNEKEIIMSALAAMQEKNAHLENSLSAETKIKLDLFSALGEAKRQLELRESHIRNQEKELEELKGKMAQVLAVMPNESFCSSPVPSSGTSKFRLSDRHIHCFSKGFNALKNYHGLTENSVSTLDPNATAYTPKGALVTSTEA
ncbi:Macoilin, putative [Pediculus humanus corporis]|uniref:Macoilin n=1 Tax=Pediculus humanus subsp. corporis TaxID=121224 RepID=E0VKR0_PEDHC|nr:Macoilin, putative [Pediculus humanus corporis]EEB13966.1 Macoilin, putative [Pediculus humanus corporis]